MSAFSVTLLVHSLNVVNSASVHVEDPGSSPLDVEPLPEPGAGVIDVLPLEPGVVEDDVPPPDVDGVMDVPPLEPGVLEDTETQRQGPEEEQVSVEEDFVLKYRTAAS